MRPPRGFLYMGRNPEDPDQVTHARPGRRTLGAEDPNPGRTLTRLLTLVREQGPPLAEFFRSHCTSRRRRKPCLCREGPDQVTHARP